MIAAALSSLVETHARGQVNKLSADLDIEGLSFLEQR